MIFLKGDEILVDSKKRYKYNTKFLSKYYVFGALDRGELIIINSYKLMFTKSVNGNTEFIKGD